MIAMMTITMKAPINPPISPKVVTGTTVGCPLPLILVTVGDIEVGVIIIAMVSDVGGGDGDGVGVVGVLIVDSGMNIIVCQTH